MHLKYIIRVNLHCKCFTLFNQRNNELGPASTLKLHMKDRLKLAVIQEEAHGISMGWLSESLSFLTKVWEEITATASFITFFCPWFLQKLQSMAKYNKAGKDNGECMCSWRGLKLYPECQELC